MFTLGIPDKQKRRTLGFLSNEYFPGGLKKLGAQIPYEIKPSEGGFFEISFPNFDEEEFRNITFQLKQQGVTVIGADSQLTERKMKLSDLLPLKENRISPPEGFTSELVKKLVSRDGDTMFFANGQHYVADGEFQDFAHDLAVIDKDGSQDYIDFKDIEFAEATHGFGGAGVEEGSCGYAPEGEDPNKAKQPAGPHLLRKKIREIIRMRESYQDNPDVKGTTGMEDTVDNPSAKAEKILMSLAKSFGHIPLDKVVNDNSYKRQAITSILFGMMNENTSINLKDLVNEGDSDIGNQPIPSKYFKRYMKEYAREISQAKEHFRPEEWNVAKNVAVYLIKAKNPTTVDEYLEWHAGAKAITGGKTFGMGSGFAKASSLIVSIVAEAGASSKQADLWDSKILPYIDNHSN